jgi:cystathionine beta-lyase
VKTGYSQLNTMGLVACQAAYTSGGEWLDELLTYLAGNYVYAKEFIEGRLPRIRLAELEGTYLLWLDLNAYGFSESELDRLITHKAGLWVDNGSIFGEEGKGFIRINAACPRSILKKAFGQLAVALE